MSTFDLFLVPTASQYKQYDKIINSLAKKYDTPSFPHITLLSMVEAEEKDLVAKVKNITKSFNKIEVKIFGMNFTNTTNQCVFAQIKMSLQLLNLFKELETNLVPSNKIPFFPHMSFVYGDYSPEEKSTIAEQVKVDKKLLLDKVVIYRYGPL